MSSRRDDATGVRAVVEVLARALTDRPDEVRVTESQHKQMTLIELFVAPGDLAQGDRPAGADGGGAADAGGDGRRARRQEGDARDSGTSVSSDCRFRVQRSEFAIESESELGRDGASSGGSPGRTAFAAR